jgi:hypothetical protein
MPGVIELTGSLTSGRSEKLTAAMVAGGVGMTGPSGGFKREQPAVKMKAATANTVIRRDMIMIPRYPSSSEIFIRLWKIHPTNI